MQIFNWQFSLIRLVTGSNRNELLVSESFLHCLHIYKDMLQRYIYIYIYLCSITFVHKRVFNYHTYRWKEEQNNYVGDK